MHDQRDYCKDNQQMNEETANVHHKESAYPQNDKHDRQQKEHIAPPFLNSSLCAATFN
jgi:hypothetical protein